MSSNEFKIQPDPTTSCGVSCPLACEKLPIGLLFEKRSLEFFSVVYDPILMILAGMKTRKSLDEFEFGQYYRVLKFILL